MTLDEREKMNRLCRLIQDEKAPKVFDELVCKLNELLEAKHERMHPEHTDSTCPNSSNVKPN